MRVGRPGPQARAKVAKVDQRFAEVGRFRVTRFDYDGVEVRVAGTGYTGEEGLEIAVPNEAAEGLLQRLVDAEITPAGLGARDTLRLEAALPLYGHELTLTSTTLEARLAGSSAGTRRRSAVARRSCANVIDVPTSC